MAMGTINATYIILENTTARPVMTNTRIMPNIEKKK